MSTITVLGAGAMGSAICTPLADAGWDVRLWGTWLDDHLLDAIERGENHPRTNQPFAQGVTLYRSSELDEALEGADTVIVSVASVGVEQVVKMALPGIVKADALMVTSKGFLEFDNGDVLLLPDSIRRIAADEGYDNLPPIIAVAGPVKANECAAREPTATIFGCKDLDVAIKYARAIRTRQLRHRGHRRRDRRGNLRSHEERLRDRARHRRRPPGEDRGSAPQPQGGHI